ncbi:MAG: hypothetical protein L0Y71_03075 [Gemmataceae bacterium]|nr:hypothetical protein [Gemmataceae bacterium]
MKTLKRKLTLEILEDRLVPSFANITFTGTLEGAKPMMMIDAVRAPSPHTSLVGNEFGDVLAFTEQDNLYKVRTAARVSMDDGVVKGITHTYNSDLVVKAAATAAIFAGANRR